MRASPDILVQRPSHVRQTWRPVFGAALGLCFLLSAAQLVSADQRPVASTPAKAPPSKAAPVAKAKRAAPVQPAPKVGAPAPELAEEPAPVSSETLRPVITGDDWQDTLLRFEQWLAVQTLYDADQVKQMQARFRERAQSTSEGNRRQFIKDTDAKLGVLYGPGVTELQENFTERMATAAPAYIKKSRQQLPDVVGLTPQQLKEQLTRFAVRYKSTVDVHQSFEQLRQAHIAANEARADMRRVEAARPAASHIATGGGANRQGRGGYTQARDYYPQTNSTISYSVIPVMPMMTSGGYALFGGGVAITITRNR